MTPNYLVSAAPPELQICQNTSTWMCLDTSEPAPRSPYHHPQTQSPFLPPVLVKRASIHAVTQVKHTTYPPRHSPYASPTRAHSTFHSPPPQAQTTLKGNYKKSQSLPPWVSAQRMFVPSSSLHLPSLLSAPSQLLEMT